jgi:Holliday junction DNA helicase RuvA
MIAQLTGTIRSVNSDRIILEVAGIGYLVHVTPVAATTLTLGNSLTLHTSMVVREDSITLYGFLDAPSLESFELVQTVSGIGPRVALSILAHLSPDQLADAVDTESVNILSGVPGIGKKGAQRILLELKGKLSRSGSPSTSVSSAQPMWREQLAGALISLGYSAREADSTISIVAIDYANRGLNPAGSDLSELLKAALAGGKS